MLIARVLDGPGQDYDRKKIADEAKNGNDGQEDSFNDVIKPTKTHVLRLPGINIWKMIIFKPSS